VRVSSQGKIELCYYEEHCVVRSSFERLGYAIIRDIVL